MNTTVDNHIENLTAIYPIKKGETVVLVHSDDGFPSWFYTDNKNNVIVSQYLGNRSISIERAGETHIINSPVKQGEFYRSRSFWYDDLPTG